jgi:hypothetical protein
MDGRGWTRWIGDEIIDVEYTPRERGKTVMTGTGGLCMDSRLLAYRIYDLIPL